MPFRVNRGLLLNLPTLVDGELAYVEDTNQLYIGSSTGNKLINVSGGTGVGPPGPAGSQGATGVRGATGTQGVTGPAGISSGGSSNLFIFKPGSIQSGNVYNSWLDLYSALTLIPGPKTIYFDNSIQSPCIIPAGNYILTDCTFQGKPTPTNLFGSLTKVQIDPGVTWAGLSNFLFLSLDFKNVTFVDTPVSHLLNFEYCEVTSNGTSAVWNITSTTSVAAKTSFFNGNISVPVFRIASNKNLFLALSVGSAINSQAINGDPTTTFSAGVLDTATNEANIVSQANFFGTTQIVSASQAYNLPYAPGATGLWSPIPKQVAEALDQLASRPITGPKGATGVGVAGSQGPTGAQGPQGSFGPQGATGIQGVTGPSGGGGGGGGATGSQGVTGLPGVTGAQGVTGPSGIGSTGLQGVQGATGPSGGPAGTTGIQGTTGIAGTQGATGVGTSGVTGTQGVTGAQGVTGPSGGGGGGATGIQGVTGLIGTTGVQGIQGVTGPSGEGGGGGITGPQGATGAIGIQGDQGVTGIGTQGSTGVQGIQGVTGPSGGGGGGGGATGPQGATGIQGIQGFQGVTGAFGGPQGVTGAQGVTGPSGGPIGETGVQGATGIAGGTTGTAGLQGPPGQTVTGIQGVTGISIQGITGTIGLQGPAGQTVTGIQGATGLSIQGVTGAVGLQGPIGQSSTGIQGFTGVGIQGITGPAGLQGPIGQQGVTGISVGRWESSIQTGTGSIQNISHSLGSIPVIVLISIYDNTASSTFVITEGSHTSSNIVVTVTNGVKFKIIAFT